MADYIPVSAFTRTGDSTWYLNIENMGLSELIELKNQLYGSKVDVGISVIDGIIYKKHCTSKFYYDYINVNNRKNHKEDRTKKSRIRKNCKEFRYGGEERW